MGLECGWELQGFGDFWSQATGSQPKQLLDKHHGAFNHGVLMGTRLAWPNPPKQRGKGKGMQKPNPGPQSSVSHRLSDEPCQ